MPLDTTTVLPPDAPASRAPPPSPPRASPLAPPPSSSPTTSPARRFAIVAPSQPAATRYFDIEASKAASMRSLGRRIAEQQTNRTPRYQDLEANKSRSQRARRTPVTLRTKTMAPTEPAPPTGLLRRRHFPGDAPAPPRQLDALGRRMSLRAPALALRASRRPLARLSGLEREWSSITCAFRARADVSDDLRQAPALDGQRECRSRPPLSDGRRSLGASPASVAGFSSDDWEQRSARPQAHNRAIAMRLAAATRSAVGASVRRSGRE